MSEVRTITDESLAQAVEIIRDGGLIVIPTDTVYGVACDPRNVEAIRKIYMVKQRPKYKPLQVLLASIDGLDALRLDLPVPLNRLAAMFMPGAFSPIAEARDNCSLATVRRDPATGKTTQGVRIPNSAATLRILRAVGPLAATSANRSGEESAQTVDEARPWAMPSTCISMEGRRQGMCRPRWSRPILTDATVSRSFERE